MGPLRCAILFDLDGTLIDSRADLATAVNLTRADYDLAPLPVDQVAGFVGEGMQVLVKRAIPEAGTRLADAVTRTREHYARHLLDETRLYPGAAEALASLRQAGCGLAVVSNKPTEFLAPILAGLGVTPLFEALLGGGSTARLKPDPEPLLHALACLTAAPAESWVVGDHFTDLEAGRRAGLRRCYCRYGFGDPRQEPYDAVADAPADWPRLLASPLPAGSRPP